MSSDMVEVPLKIEVSMLLKKLNHSLSRLTTSRDQNKGRTQMGGATYLAPVGTAGNDTEPVTFVMSEEGVSSNPGN